LQPKQVIRCTSVQRTKRPKPEQRRRASHMHQIRPEGSMVVITGGFSATNTPCQLVREASPPHTHGDTDSPLDPFALHSAAGCNPEKMKENVVGRVAGESHE